MPLIKRIIKLLKESPLPCTTMDITHILLPNRVYGRQAVLIELMKLYKADVVTKCGTRKGITKPSYLWKLKTY